MSGEAGKYAWGDCSYGVAGVKLKGFSNLVVGVTCGDDEGWSDGDGSGLMDCPELFRDLVMVGRRLGSPEGVTSSRARVPCSFHCNFLCLAEFGSGRRPGFFGPSLFGVPRLRPPIFS